MAKNYKVTLKLTKNLEIENVNQIKKILKEADASLNESLGWRLSYEFKHICDSKPTITIRKFDAEEILSLVRAGVQSIKIKHQGVGYEIRLNKRRYMVFANNPKCCVCSLAGSQVRIEKQPSDKTPHLNLYGVDQKGSLILMTQDHILPKSHGGSDDFDNLQTMCVICNNLKANSRLDPEKLRNFRKVSEVYKCNKDLTGKDKKTLLNMLRFFMDDN